MILLLIVAVIFLIMAVQLWRGKWSFLVAGYPRMDRKYRDEKNIAALHKLTAIIYGGCAIGIGLVGLNTMVRLPWLVPFAMVVILVSGVGGTFYGNNSSRFHRGEKTDEGLADSENSRRWGSFAVFCSILVTAGVATLFYLGTRPPDFELAEDYLRINGLYGVTIKFPEIMSIELLDFPMNDFPPGRRINGFDAGNHQLRGHFESGLLFVNDQKSPTLLIRRWEDEPIFISFQKKTETEDLHKQLLDVISKSPQADMIESDSAEES